MKATKYAKQIHSYSGNVILVKQKISNFWARRAQFLWANLIWLTINFLKTHAPCIVIGDNVCMLFVLLMIKERNSCPVWAISIYVNVSAKKICFSKFIECIQSEKAHHTHTVNKHCRHRQIDIRMQISYVFMIAFFT